MSPRLQKATVQGVDKANKMFGFPSVEQTAAALNGGNLSGDFKAKVANAIITIATAGEEGEGGGTKKIGPAGDAGAVVTKQIPEGWEAKTANKGNGTKFLDPDNPNGNNVRVQGGNPDSPNPAQQEPYVKQMSNGKMVDVNGNQVDPKSAESHLPKQDFQFKPR
jgi:hypothetical protein